MVQENIKEKTSYKFEKQLVKYLKQGYVICSTTIEVRKDFDFRYKAILRKI